MGGGSDLPAFYRAEPGVVVSTTIDKYIYITVNKAFEHNIRASYSQTEIVDHVDKVGHPLIREAMKHTGVMQGVEITSIADVPSHGTGLGSSSAYLVGLLNALWAYQGVHASARRLAQEACHIELDVLGEPIGKQDQTIAAHGGLHQIRFNPDESVFVKPVICHKRTRLALEERIQLYYTGITRSASEILARQNEQIPDKREALRQMVAMAEEVFDVLCDNRPLERVGELLHRSWELKRQLAPGITTGEVDRLYAAARQAGAMGGKLSGAGGGGFLLLWVEPDSQQRVREALASLRAFPVRLEPEGSKIIYIED